MSKIESKNPGQVFALLFLVMACFVFALFISVTYSPKIIESETLLRDLRHAVALGESGDFMKAYAELSALSKRYPESPNVWLNLGIAHLTLNQLDAAEKAFQYTVELSPDDYDAWAELGGVSVRRKKLEEAFDIFNKIPPGQGRMSERLRKDPVLLELESDGRFQALLLKHGLASSVSQAR